MYKYGMKYRGFSPMCQPMNGLVEVLDDEYYHNILIYDRMLTSEETKSYELDYIGEIKEER